MSLAAAPQSASRGQARHEIPAKFDTATGLLLVPVAVNDSTSWCSLDTGFSALLTLDERLTERARLTPGAARPTPDGRPPSPRDREARATVDVGGVRLRDQPVILRAFPPEAPDMQCVMGVGILRDYIVEFDYDTPKVRLYSRDEFTAGRAAAVPLTVRRNTPFVDVEVQVDDGTLRHAHMVVDTGASYFSLVFVPSFVESAGLLAVTRPARWPSAGALSPLAARFKAVTVGPWTIPAQVGALLESSIGPGMDDGLLGSGFLRQFTVAIDFVNAKLYLTPNKRFGAPHAFDASGVAFRRASDGSGYGVAVVLPDTPAGRADVHVGDRLVRVNGIAAETLTPSELHDFFTRAGVTLTLELMRGEKSLTTTLRLEQRL